MSNRLRALRATLAGVLIVVPPAAAAQRPPDFSGHWVLVSATSSGGRGSDPAARREHPITSNTISGAPFNCGRECTIVHKGQTLTIDGAYLASNPSPAPTVTLQLDGRQASVVDSFSPARQIPVTARWNGARLQITSPGGRHTVTQAMSIEASQLVVVITTDVEGDAPVTLKYKRQQP